jgi:hypothetical protein
LCGEICEILVLLAVVIALITFVVVVVVVKVFNSVVLDDPRKTVYKNVNRGSRETDPSQVYFG